MCVVQIPLKLIMSFPTAFKSSPGKFLQDFPSIVELYQQSLISRKSIKEYCRISEYKLNLLLRAYYEDRLDAELKRMSTAP